MSQVRLATLPEIEVAVWQELTRAVHDKHHEWRTLVLATVAKVDGELTTDARNVVLREVNAGAKQLVIYTDARARRQSRADRAHARELPARSMAGMGKPGLDERQSDPRAECQGRAQRQR